MAEIVDRRKLLAPDHRAQEVQDWVASNTDAPGPDTFSIKYQLDYAQFLLGNYDSVPDEVYYACMLNSIPYARNTLRAMLFCKTPMSVMTSATEVEEQTILAYEKLFFDAGVFKNRLIKMAYVRALSPKNEDEEQTKSLFLWGLQLGWEYLVWKTTGGQTSISTVEIMRKLMADSLWRSREHIFNSITDKRSKEARAWMPIAIKLAEQVTKADPDKVNSLEELKIRLEGLDATSTRTKLGEVEILS